MAANKSPRVYKVCDLCCNESEVWALGFCDHVTCLECSARMRLLCGSKECPVCREHLAKVLVVKEVQPFSKWSPLTRNWRADRRNGFFFQTPKLMDVYYQLKSYECIKCVSTTPSFPAFYNFKQLRDHVSKTHDLYYCDICVQNLKLFPKEFKTYSRLELTRHRREGDIDDKSHRGHPLCEFCDDRFFDNDDLFAHLRRNHFWCHICESNGKQDFYPDYHLLRVHFRKDHFLCEDGECKQEKFTSVFRSKIDIQAHRATVHTKGLSKSEAKQLRQIDVGFTYSSGSGGRGAGASTGAFTTVPRSRASRTQDHKEREAMDLATALSTSLQIKTSESKKKKTSPKADRKRRSPVDNTPIPLQAEVKTEKFPIDNDKSKLEKPPGFHSEPPKAKIVTSEESADVEWPDLSGSQTQTSKAPQVYNIVGFDNAVNQRPLVGLNPAAPVPRTVVANTAPRNHSSDNSNLLRLMNSTPNPGIVRNPPPPGFSGNGAVQPPQLVPSNASDSVPRMDLRSVEIQVIKNIHRVLDNDQAKFMQFKTLSGWYRNSEITAAEYEKQCSELFGDTWQNVGPQIAHVMPIEQKRRELLSFFEAPTNAAVIVSGGMKKKGKNGRAKVPLRSITTGCPGSDAIQWPSLSSGGSGTFPSQMLSEDDYPSLGAAANQSGSSKIAGPWNGRVSACI